jgi:hypothetical protein
MYDTDSTSHLFGIILGLDVDSSPPRYLWSASDPQAVSMPDSIRQKAQDQTFRAARV